MRHYELTEKAWRLFRPTLADLFTPEQVTALREGGYGFVRVGEAS